MMNLIDTHFHLDHYKNYLEMARNITELKQYTICVTNSPGVFWTCKNQITETKYLKFAIGFHPQESTLDENDIKDFMRLIMLTNYIGEVGLDYSAKSYMDKQLQLRFFEQIVELCASENKLMTIHTGEQKKMLFVFWQNTTPKSNCALVYGKSRTIC